MGMDFHSYREYVVYNFVLKSTVVVRLIEVDIIVDFGSPQRDVSGLDFILIMTVIFI